jgi:hypothetical protein
MGCWNFSDGEPFGRVLQLMYDSDGMTHRRTTRLAQDREALPPGERVGGVGGWPEPVPWVHGVCPLAYMPTQHPHIHTHIHMG